MSSATKITGESPNTRGKLSSRRPRFFMYMSSLLLMAMILVLVFSRHIDIAYTSQPDLYFCSFSRNGLMFGHIEYKTNYSSYCPAGGIYILEYFQGTSMSNHGMHYEKNWLSRYLVYAGPGSADNAHRSSHIIVVSIWPILGFFILLAYLLRGELMKRSNIAIDSCIQCGYDLKGNTTGLCPECGHSVPADTLPRTHPTDSHHYFRAKPKANRRSGTPRA